MKSFLFIAAITWASIWLTPNQQGQRYFTRGDFKLAAELFEEPMWQGAAWYRAGEFKLAAEAFSKHSTAEAYYNRGNALLMLGKYEDAVTSYDQALKLKPDWSQAFENRQLATARGRLTKQTGGELGDQKIGADQIVFDNKKRQSGQETELVAEQASSDNAVQAMWLRRVQTKPADFLRSKFAYQQAYAEDQKTK